MSHSAKPDYRGDLQGLRAIAVILVIAYHLDLPWLASGFVGVDVFFVISGYLITRLLVLECSHSGRIGLAVFYAKRIKRLLPAMLMMIALITLFSYWALPQSAWVQQTVSAPYALTWSSNLFFAFREIGYFDDLAKMDLYLHTWSLGVEEQFYLIWPLLLIVLLRKIRWTLSGMGMLLIGGLLLSAFLVQTYPQQGFYQMPSRVWQFALGGLAFLAFAPAVSRAHYPLPLQAWLLPLGLVLILVGAAGWLANLPYPGLAALPPSIGAAMVIIGGATTQFPKKLLDNPLMRWIGDRSYSLYLWHWPILTLWGIDKDTESYLLHVLGIVTLTLVIANFSYRFIEYPFWKGKLSSVSHKPVLLIGLTLVVLLASLFMRFHTQERAQLEGDQLHARLTQDVPVIYRMPCDSWYHSDVVQPCVFGPNDAKHTVALIGDSIGAQWFSALPTMFNQKDWRIVVLTKSSCPMVDEPYYYPRIGARYEVCERWRKGVTKTLKTLKPDVVIAGSSSTYESFGKTEWIDGSKRFFASFADATEQILVIPGTPLLGFDGPSCLLKYRSAIGSDDLANECASQGRMTQPDEVATYLEAALSGIPNATTLYLNDLVCPDGRCSAWDHDGVAVYRDARHLSDSFVRAKSKIIAQRIADKINN